MNWHLIDLSIFALWGLGLVVYGVLAKKFRWSIGGEVSEKPIPVWLARPLFIGVGALCAIKGLVDLIFEFSANH